MAAYRLNYIRKTLEAAEDAGLIRSWYAYSPDGRRRWVIEWARGISDRTYWTAEAGAVCDALTVAMTKPS